MPTLAARALSLVAPAFCWSCGADSLRAEPLCPRCRRELRWLERGQEPLAGLALWAPLSYEGPAAALVRGLKYRGAAGLAGPRAAQMAATAPPGLLEAPAALVPVPLHPSRRRRRGFNQAERLAAALSRRTGMPVEDCLARRGPRGRQVGRGRAERMGGPPGAFAVRAGRPAPPTVVLVDDVATTGATLAACAAALRASGSRRLSAIAYARTPGR